MTARTHHTGTAHPEAVPAVDVPAHESATTQFTSHGAVPAVGAGVHGSTPTASELAYHQTAHRAPSQAHIGAQHQIDVGNLVHGTHVNAGVEKLVSGLEAHGGAVAARADGLAKLEAVFDDSRNTAQLEQLTHTHDKQALKAWLYHHETAVVATHDGAANRPTRAVVDEVAEFLSTHPGAHALIDEAGKGRWSLVQHVAQKLGHDHPALRGEWGAYISAKHGGLRTAKVERTLGALRDAGASAVYENYDAGPNAWHAVNARLAEAKRSLAELRAYFAHPGVAIGIDGPRVELPRLEPLEHRLAGLETKAHALEAKLQASPAEHDALAHELAHVRHQIEQVHHELDPMRKKYLHRIAAEEGRAHSELRGVQTGTWVSRLEGDSASDAAELSPLLRR